MSSVHTSMTTRVMNISSGGIGLLLIIVIKSAPSIADKHTTAIVQNIDCILFRFFIIEEYW